MRYTKMHGAGNSFVITETLHGELQGEDLSVLALKLCREQHTDGLIVIIPAAGADFGMLFYNADGSFGEMCGNGARCLARYGVEHGLVSDPENIRIHATAGQVSARRLTRERYELRLNDPSVVDLHRSAFDGERVRNCAYIELGNPGIPHAIVTAEPGELNELNTLRRRGRMLRQDPAFPRGANVSFIRPMENGAIRAITYERGVEDFTLACGTGCGAIATALALSGAVPNGRIEIDMPGGRLSVSLRRTGDTVRDILLTGSTAVVEEGITE